MFSLLLAYATAVPSPLARPEADPEADPAVLASSSRVTVPQTTSLYYAAYPYYTHLTYPYGWGYGYYGHLLGKRSAEPEYQAARPRPYDLMQRHRRSAEAGPYPQPEGSPAAGPDAGPDADADADAWYYSYYGGYPYYRYGYGYGLGYYYRYPYYGYGLYYGK